MTALSALIITHNEEKVIARCLESLVWCDEIIVVDSFSSDKTPEICKNPNAAWAKNIHFIQRKWDGFRNQRNFSLEKAKNDWVLVIDSDEKCSNELKAKIQSILSQSDPSQKYYKVRRQEFFLGQAIQYGIWNPSYQDRFFHKKGIQYINDIHEYPNYPSQPDRIHEPLIHWPDFNPEQFLDKMNRYTSVEAKDRFDKGQRTNLFRLLTSGPAMFFKNYFYYQSYRDGFLGLIISLLEGVSRTVRHIKIWRLQNSSSLSKQTETEVPSL